MSTLRIGTAAGHNRFKVSHFRFWEDRTCLWASRFTVWPDPFLGE